MPVWATSPSVFDDISSDTKRSKSYIVPVSATGLNVNTKFTFFLDQIDYTWACKPFGGKLGDDLVSDSSGKLSFSFLYDFQYEGNYAFDNLPQTPQTGSQYSATTAGDQPYYFTTNRFIELKGPGSAYASAYFPLKLLIIPAHVNRQEQHSHDFGTILLILLTGLGIMKFWVSTPSDGFWSSAWNTVSSIFGSIAGTSGFI